MKLSQCFNWKVIVGVFALIAGVYFFWPGYFIRFLPFLIVLICPLAMVLMMVGMNSCRSSDQTDQTDKKRTYTCPECLLKYEDKTWAEQCSAWCKVHHSCNIDITRHAINK